MCRKPRFAQIFGGSTLRDRQSQFAVRLAVAHATAAVDLQRVLIVRKIKLLDLEPHFLKLVTPLAYEHTDDVALSDGMIFLCPACYWSNDGKVGTPVASSCSEHRAARGCPFALRRCGFRSARLRRPHGRKAGSSSVHLIGGCRAHIYIRGGKVDFC